MANGVFTAKLGSSYDDAVEVRYHFPKQYRSRVERTVGDWIVYYESRRGGGRKVYFAMARVVAIEPDPLKADHYYARMSGYVEFPQPVGFRHGGDLLESSLRNPDGSTNRGAGMNAVRLLPRIDFEHICRLGMLPALDDTGAGSADLVAETQSGYGGPRMLVSTSRPLRDAAFSRVVRNAYDRTCAMTGLQLVNGGGRCEIEAAHIRPVENDGPDSPRNGLALCRTVHWLFDRGFLSVADDGAILQAPKVPDPVRRLLNPEGTILFPKDRSLSPHTIFLHWHREHRFKG